MGAPCSAVLGKWGGDTKQPFLFECTQVACRTRVFYDKGTQVWPSNND